MLARAGDCLGEMEGPSLLGDVADVDDRAITWRHGRHRFPSGKILEHRVGLAEELGIARLCENHRPGPFRRPQDRSRHPAKDLFERNVLRGDLGRNVLVNIKHDPGATTRQDAGQKRFRVDQHSHVKFPTQ